MSLEKTSLKDLLLGEHVSLEEKIEEPKSERLGLMHYTKLTVYSVADALIANFIIPTRKRQKRETDHSGIRDATTHDPTFLEEVLFDAPHTTIPIMQLVYALAEPRFLATIVGTNILSLGYEVYRTRKIKRGIKIPLAPDHGKIVSGKSEWVSEEDQVERPQVVVNPPKKKRSVLEKARVAIKGMARSLALRVCSYTLVGALAVAHYNIAGRIGEPRIDSNLVNFETMECKLERGETEHQFYMIGEVHYYNASSHVYMKRLVDDKGIDVLLSEGTPPDLEVATSVKGGNIAEVLLFLGITPIWLGAGWNYQGPSQICADKGIPVVYLERRYKVPKTVEHIPVGGSDGVVMLEPGEPDIDPDLDGVREGMTKGENIALGAIGGLAIISAPYLYFAFTPLRNHKMPVIFKWIAPGIDLLMPGLLHGRNEHMADAIVDYMSAHPDDLPLVRVGGAHVDGLKEILEDKGQLYCRDVPIDEFAPPINTTNK